MTALKPIENRRVRGVASERYPLNEKCAHPECTEPVNDPHHCFPRSQIAGDSWFVLIIEPDDVQEAPLRPAIIPHVAGLCRKHHDDVEEHRAWIKLEDGVFVWYDRDTSPGKPQYDSAGGNVEWIEIGPLNPQPGSRESKPKRKRFKGEARRKRTTVSIKVPKDAQEDGGAIWDERLEMVKARMTREGLDPDRPPYHLLTDVMYDWSTS